MELYFMPSDIARLILGYLQENSYLKTYNCFLRECGHLRELYNLEKAGRSLKKVTQLSLIKIVEEWGRYKYSSEAKHTGVTSVTGTPSSDDTVDDNLVFDNDVTSSGRKTKQRASSGWLSKKSPQVSKVRRSPSTPKMVKVRLKSPRAGTEIQNLEIDNSFEENAAQPGHSKPTIEASDGSKNSSPTKTAHSKLKLHSQGDVRDDTRKPEELLDETETFNSKVSTEQAVPGSQTSDSLRKSAENVIINKMRVALFKQLESQIKGGEMFRHEKKVNKLTEQENFRTSFSEHETDKPEPGLGNNTREENTQNTEILSETYIKPVSEPPSESVGSVEDKCLSWMTRNESEGTNNTAETSDIAATVVERKSSPKSSNEGSPTIVHATPMKMTHSATKNRLLVTPVKLLLSSEHNTSKSPRRKKPKTPRKRASEVSPVSSVVSSKPVETSNIFEKILSDHRLHEKLAETCNLVHSQIKLANSGREHRDKSDTTQAEQVSQVPLHHAEEQETVTASRSLEEILGIDHNFHTDLLSDNIDMSDPAYESLFRLFGTDRETFNEYLRREKEKELALMEAEVEELERSNHEILCANFGVSQADAGYETQELAYNSPHHIVHGTQHDHLSSNLNLHSPRTSHVTSTPCGTGAIVNFTPLLRGNELGNSPVHSTSIVLGGSEKNGIVTKASPGSTETQPFSPALSHYSEVNNPPTPRHQQHLSSYINGGSPGVPHTPKSHTVDPYSNPATPQQSSPQHNQLLHSTPTGSVRSRTDSEHFHQSSPIHPQHNTITNMHLPTQCSPLVKADLHPQSPFSTQNQTSFFQSATNNGLYFNSHVIVRANTQNGQNLEHNVNNSAGMKNFSDHPGYMDLLTDDGSNVRTSREHCTTIENSIGCISLPQPTNQATRAEDGKKGAARKSRRKKPPVKRKEAFASLKEILNKPLRFPNSVPITMTAPGLHLLPKTPEKRIPDDVNLTFRSPGGKTMINVPVLNCEDEIDLSILGMEENVDADGSQIVNVYGQSLDTSTQYTIAPENQATHNLANAIHAGNTADAVKQMSQWKNTESKSRKKGTPERKSKVKRKKHEVVKADQHKEDLNSIPSSSDHLVFHQDGFLDPNEAVYTATLDTSVGKAATARALNFGPNVDNYRKIMPKPCQETGPSVLILSSKQVVNPGHKIVVNTTPVTLVQNSSDSVVQSNEKVNENDELPKTESISTIKIIDMSDSSVEKKGALSTSTSNEKDPVVEDNIGISMKAHSQEKTPNKVKQNSGHNSDCSSEKRVTRSVTLLKSTEKQSKSVKVNQSSDKKVTENEQKLLNTPKKDIKVKMLCKSAKVNLGTALNCDGSSKENNSTQSSHRDYNENIPDAGEESENKIDMKEFGENGNKSNKNGLKSRTCKNKKGKGNEKLKVKLPVMSNRHVNQKTKEKKSEKVLIPFYFKKKHEDLAEISSSDEDLPLSEVRKQQVKTRSKRKQKEFQSVKIVIDSESTDEDTEALKEKVQLTPKKRMESSDEDRTPSKEILFEKIGLTPKKLVMESEFKSPRRKNVLDVLAEWQGSPSSGKCQEVKSVESHRSPRTPGKRGHAKQLFSSPDKKKSSFKVCKKAKQTAKRVDGIIDRLKQNNPGRNLDGSKYLSQDKNDENEIIETDVLRVTNVNPGVNDVTEDSVKNSNEMIKNDIKTTLLDENEQVVTCDENSIPADCNSQDENELDQAIASIAFKQQDALDDKKVISEEENDIECNPNENAEQNDGNSLGHSPERQCVNETGTENVKHSNTEAYSVKQDNMEDGTVNSEQVENRRKHKKKKHRHRHRHRHRSDKNYEINGVDDQTGNCLDTGAGHHHHHKKRRRSKKRHLEEGEDGRERKRRRKEKRGETTNTSVEMDSLAAINIDEAITKIYGT